MNTVRIGIGPDQPEGRDPATKGRRSQSKGEEGLPVSREEHWTRIAITANTIDRWGQVTIYKARGLAATNPSRLVEYVSR